MPITRLAMTIVGIEAPRGIAVICRARVSDEIPTKLVVSIHVNWGRTRPSAEASSLHQSEGRTLLADTIQGD